MTDDAHSIYQPHQRCFCIVNSRIRLAILVQKIQTRPQTRIRGRRGKLARGNTHVDGCAHVCCICYQVLLQVSITHSGRGHWVGKKGFASELSLCTSRSGITKGRMILKCAYRRFANGKGAVIGHQETDDFIGGRGA